MHALSIDVEDWYHDGGRPSGSKVGARVEFNTNHLLDLIDEAGARATLFFLGEVAEQYPALVRRAVASGHEIASHGYVHKPTDALLREEFRQNVKRSVGLLEDLAGTRVLGYRAPYFSIRSGVRWPIDILLEAGLKYDSSILPIDRPPGLELVCPRSPFRHHNGLWEFPVAILRLFFFWHLPLASGAGLRLLPSRLLKNCLRRFESEVGAGVFYLHPWELDPGSPTGAGPGRWLLRLGRHRLGERLERMLRGAAFAPIRQVFGEQLSDALPSGADAP